MIRDLTSDPFLNKQPDKLFIDELKKPVHREKPSHFGKRTVHQDEVDASGIYLVTEFEDRLLETCYADFELFADIYGISGKKYPLITRKGETEVYEQYKICSDAEKTVITASDTEGIRRGIIYIEDEMRRRDGALLPKGETVRTPWITSRITRCFFSPTNRPPKNGEELADDIDYYPDEYLNRLAHDGANGVWIYTRFRDILPSKIIPEYGTDYQRRIDKLNKTISKCRRYGIKVFVFAIEPVPPRGDLYEKYPDLRGNMAWDGYTFCTASERGKAYCEEATRTMFELCPDLGGYICITNGERTTNCSGGLHEPQFHVCPNCKDKRAGEILAKAVDALREGIRHSKPEAEFLSWTYGHRLWSFDDIREYVQKAPSDVCLVQNLEDNGINVQLGQPRIAMDYWLSYPGPSDMFKITAQEAKKCNKHCYAKIQACCSHEVASVPYVPVPGILFDKYKAMQELGVSGVMQCWYFGNYPSLMNKVAGELAFWGDFDDKEGFLRHIAGIYWGMDNAQKVVSAWNCFEKGYLNYPTTIMFSYYGPMHDGPVWLLQLKPKNFPLARSWIYGDPMDGDRIQECTLRGHTVSEAMVLSKTMSTYWHRGLEIMKGLEGDTYDEFEQKSVAEALDCQFESGAEILEFYLLRDRLGSCKENQADILCRMEDIVRREIDISRRLSKISAHDGRLGYHSEAEGFRYFPAKLDSRADYLERLLNTEFCEVSKRISDGLAPLEYYRGVEPGAKRYRLGSGWDSFASGKAQVRLTDNGQKLVLEFRSRRDEGLVVAPEFKLFDIGVPVYISKDGKAEIPDRVWMYFSMFKDEVKAEIEKYEIEKLPSSEDFEGTHLRITMDKQKLGYTGEPAKIALRTTLDDFWQPNPDSTVYLGKYDIAPCTYVWLDA